MSDKPQQPASKPSTKIEEPKNSKKGLIIGLISILIIIIGIQAYMNYNTKEELGVVITEKESEIEETIAEMNAMSVELDEKIKTISELGGDVEELQKVKEELEAERNQLKKSSNSGWSSYKKVKEKMEGYAVLLKQKDVEIEQLKSINDELFSENTELKDVQNQLSDSLNQLSQEKETLKDQVAVASQLKAENINIFAVNAKGRERTGEFRNKHIDDIRIEFNLAENKVAPIGGIDIIVRIIDANGDVIFDVANGSGTFIYSGKEEFYTSKQEILFDNSKQSLSFSYKKGSDYDLGKHVVEVYADDYIIGASNFTVK